MIDPVHTRITVEPEKMDGQPCIRDLRFPVVTVLRMVAAGMSTDEIIDEHPDLEVDDVSAALNYAAEHSFEGVGPLPAATQERARDVGRPMRISRY